MRTSLEIVLTGCRILFLAGLVVLVALGGCSGARQQQSGPPATTKSKPCADKPDAGKVDQGYYSIGTCPVDEEELDEVKDDD